LSESLSCKREVELTVAVAEVEAETERVVAELQKRVRLPGFRPGKAPVALIRTRFQEDIKQEVVEHLVPRTFRAHADRENLKVVGNPGVTEIHFHAGEPLKFKAEFEVAPEFDLGDYRELEVPYAEPKVTEEDVDSRLNTIRDQRADFVNVDPRPVADGDFAVVSLKSIAGVEGDPIDQDEMMLHIGDGETMPAFTEGLRGVTPGETKEVEVAYPENYGSERLAGKTVRFAVTLKGLRRKELPELNDEFAKDLGDYQGVEELKEEIRKAILREREFTAQQAAKSKLVDKLVETHDFSVPDTFVDRQIEMNVEGRLRELAAAGADLSQLKLNWDDIRESQREQAVKDVKASLILDRIAEREAIETLADEVDREVQRVARQQQEPVPAVRKRLEDEGVIRRIASRIRTDKTLNFLFEQSRKVAPEQS
jgi:trigger factor